MMTVAIEAIAFGAIKLKLLNPNNFTKIAGIQYEPGILSKVEVPAESNAPKKKLLKLRLMLFGMAA